MENKQIAAVAAVLIVAFLILNSNTIRTFTTCEKTNHYIDAEYHRYLCLGIKSALNESSPYSTLRSTTDLKIEDPCVKEKMSIGIDYETARTSCMTKINDTCYHNQAGEKCNGLQIPTFIFDTMTS